MLSSVRDPTVASTVFLCWMMVEYVLLNRVINFKTVGFFK
jgi:hypothetical protein